MKDYSDKEENEQDFWTWKEVLAALFICAVIVFMGMFFPWVVV